MVSTIISFVLHVFMFLGCYPVNAETWIKAGYWDSRDEFPISSINSSLFTHLICSSADINPLSFQVYLSPYNEMLFSNFTEIVKQKNPSVTTLLSIEGTNLTLSSMASDSSYRKSFIDSSLRLARLCGFQGLELAWTSLNSMNDTFNMDLLLEQWRAAVEVEAKNVSQRQLILTARFGYSPRSRFANYPVPAIQQYLNWVHVFTAEYSNPSSENQNLTTAHSALRDPSSLLNTDYGIDAWIEAGLSADKLVLCLPFYGYAWTLRNPGINGIGAATTGPAITASGLVYYKEIRNYIHDYGPNVPVMYNSIYAMNYWSTATTWIGFDDIEAIRDKTSYAKRRKLLGYCVWRVSFDKFWTLSRAAADEDMNVVSSPAANNNNSNYENADHSKQKLLVAILTSAIGTVLLVGFLIYYVWMRKLKLNKKKDSCNANRLESRVSKAAAAEDLNTNVPNLIEYALNEIEACTNRFSIENRLGEGGYGPVYKGVLPNGEEIAVKKLSKTSTQGFEEFKNEVTLTAKLQHVNLVRVLGFCIDEEEQMLIYEYMPKNSLDHYIFDPIKKFILDWKKRVHIIEGVTQGLLYLQEYSRLTIIHRDLKASNVLLDDDLKPKISDFGMARIFVKEEVEANTERNAGTRGYIPPEYISRGIYSTKFDVYSFGILLLEIISGRRVSTLHGPNENLSLVNYAYELWKDGNGVKFFDPTLDDTNSSCKLMRCLQIALLCVRENPNDRPSILKVYSMLKNENTDPKKPAFSEEDDRTIELSLQIQMWSVNDVTISEVVAR